ncbi:MAG: metallophosphoesterase [Erysipelotrichaceae bacterium]|nr:metallophosphoesterase [Erysipelotrichaceae bacterium]
MKIALCSDNHGLTEALEIIKRENPDCDYYWHLGDSQADTPEEISPFISVKGNNDWPNIFPRFRVLSANGHYFFLIHGDGYIYNLKNLVELARNNGCQTVLFGHTHIFTHTQLMGMELINPGSCCYNRNGEGPTYAILHIDDNGNLKLEKKFIDKNPEFFL